MATTGTGSAGLSTSVKEQVTGEAVAVTSLNAVPVVGPALAAIGSVVLGAHVAKLKDATSENQAVDSAIPAFDIDLQTLVTAINNGQYSPSQGSVAAATMNSQLYNYFHSLVGKPGTAWSGTPLPCGAPSQSTAKCNSGCTVGCCIYNNCIAQPMDCLIKGLAGSPGSSTTIAVPEIYPGKYSTYTRPAYSLTLTIPQTPVVSVVNSLTAGSLSTVAAALGVSGTSAATSGSSLLKWGVIVALFIAAIIAAVKFAE